LNSLSDAAASSEFRRPLSETIWNLTQPDTTCWTLIQAAAAGDEHQRNEFAARYLDAVRAYLIARWSNSSYLQLVDDAVQDVFVECFRNQGPLNRIDARRTTSFRAFLYGLVRNVARRVEVKQGRIAAKFSEAPNNIEIVSDETALSKVFDRTWAKSIMRQAAEFHKISASADGPEASRRVELLRLRFTEGLAIRQIAELWEFDAAVLHREYSKARKEFHAALLHVVRFHHPGSDVEVELEAQSLLDLLA
jgi:RNA polymerase sigma-70 factor (ECF subfamily)